MWIVIEAATGGIKKRVLKILQNLEENTCARVSFSIKLQAYLKRDSDTGVLCAFFSELFSEQFWATAFVIRQYKELHNTKAKLT